MVPTRLVIVRFLVSKGVVRLIPVLMFGIAPPRDRSDWAGPSFREQRRLGWDPTSLVSEQ